MIENNLCLQSLLSLLQFPFFPFFSIPDSFEILFGAYLKWEVGTSVYLIILHVSLEVSLKMRMQLFDVRNKIEKYTYQIRISFNNLHENIDSKIALYKTEAFITKAMKPIKIGDFCKFNWIIFFVQQICFFSF